MLVSKRWYWGYVQSLTSVAEVRIQELVKRPFIEQEDEPDKATGEFFEPKHGADNGGVDW